MKQANVPVKTVLFLLSLFMLLMPEVTEAKQVSVISAGGAMGGWEVYPGDITKDPSNMPPPIGWSQNVCLTASLPPNSTPVPSNCPINDTPAPTVYGYNNQAWAPDPSNLTMAGISGPKWIWAPNITGMTTSAANATYTFQTYLVLCAAAAKDATIYIAADDHADVYFNKVLVGSTSNGADQFTPITISKDKIGQFNQIWVVATNGLNPPNCGSGQYQCNPAGFIFGATAEDVLPMWPQCTGTQAPDSGKVFDPGTSESLTCNKPGDPTSQVCICTGIGNSTIWYPSGSCPQPECTDGQTKPVSCPSPTTGSAVSKCQSGKWTPPDLSACVAPQCVGDATEPVSCPSPTTMGSAFRKCQAGTWQPPDFSGCQLPPAGPDGICGSDGKNQTAACPSGVACGTRAFGGQDNGPAALNTTEWYCGADWNYPLGASCEPHQCASGHCDWGDGTSKTNSCVPGNGTGIVGDFCTNNSQCASTRCGGLHQDISGNWQAGHCSTGPSALGEYCSTNTDCTSNYCDRGDGTSKTSKCMPHGPTGKTGAWCSNNNQCSKGTCGGLVPGPNQSWQPGHCN